MAQMIPPGHNAWRVFDAVTANPYGITMNNLISSVWPHPDLEPGYPETGLQVCIARMNRWWKKRGVALRIKGTGGPGSRYQMWIGPFR